MSKINFLGIGAQKAGTSWLHDVLNLHPEIWLHPIKEIHYFDCMHGVTTQESVKFQRFLSLNKHLERLKDKEINPLDFKELSKTDRIVLLSLAKLAFGYYDDLMYISLFEGISSPVIGEITPEYSALDESGIQHIRNLLGEDLKVVYMIRDPMHRVWSMFRMHCSHQNIFPKSVEEIRKEILKEKFLNASDIRTDYIKTIKVIEKYFKNVKYIIYDQVCHEPLNVIESVCGFLLIDFKEEYFIKKINKKINLGTSVSLSLPEEIIDLLNDRYRDQKEFVMDKLGLSEEDLCK